MSRLFARSENSGRHLAIWAVVLALLPQIGPAETLAQRDRITVSQAEFGERWPLTVPNGVLICDQSKSALGAIVFEVEGKRYGVNGTAKTLGYPPIDPIWKVSRGSYPTPVARLSEPQRRKIFAALVGCQDKGSGTAHDVACQKQTRTRYTLTEKELRQIASEGIELSWPPLTPSRVSIGPLIERGLQLCKRR